MTSSPLWRSTYPISSGMPRQPIETFCHPTLICFINSLATWASTTNPSKVWAQSTCQLAGLESIRSMIWSGRMHISPMRSQPQCSPPAKRPQPSLPEPKLSPIKIRKARDLLRLSRSRPIEMCTLKMMKKTSRNTSTLALMRACPAKSLCPRSPSQSRSPRPILKRPLVVACGRKRRDSLSVSSTPSIPQS